jgi:dUTP pyrophosphatase
MENKLRGFEAVPEGFRKNEGEVRLPLRGTKTSAGYDFYAPVDLVIKPQEKVFFWTDVRAYMQPNEALILDIRSSMGTKQDLMISNVIPLIDSDYYDNADTKGNIGINLRNLKPAFKLKGYNKTIKVFAGEAKGTISVPEILDLTVENTIVIKAGEKIAQGVFINYLESDNCNTDVERTGGFGSTGIK